MYRITLIISKECQSTGLSEYLLLQFLRFNGGEILPGVDKTLYKTSNEGLSSDVTKHNIKVKVFFYRKVKWYTPFRFICGPHRFKCFDLLFQLCDTF